MEEILQKLLVAFQNGEDATITIDGDEQKILSSQLDNILPEFATTKAGQKHLAAMAQNKKLGEISNLANQVVSIAGQTSDIKNSNEQIRVAKEGIAKLRKPQAPPVDGVDPALNQEIYNAQMGTTDQSQLAASARAGYDDVYNRDMAQARASSTGQAGAYGAMGQLASGRRNRAETRLAPEMNTIRRGEQERLRMLLGQREGQNARRASQRQGLYNTQLNQYNTEAGALGDLMSTGMSNKRNAWRAMGRSVSQLPTSLGSMFDFQGQLPRTLPRVNMSQDFDLMDYEEMINKNIGLNPYTA